MKAKNFVNCKNFGEKFDLFTLLPETLLSLNKTRHFSVMDGKCVRGFFSLPTKPSNRQQFVK